MDRRQYKRHEVKINAMLLKYQYDNDIDDEWFLRLLLDTAQRNVVRFKEEKK